MTKHVNFDEELNKVQEFERIPREEKMNHWVSREQIQLFRQELQAEAIMEQAKAMVTKTVLELSKKSEESEEVQQMVGTVMSQGIDGVLDFLSEHGQSILPTDDAATSSNREAAIPAPIVDPEGQVRNMVRRKLVLVQEESFLSQEDLERHVDTIMKMPRANIAEFLQQENKSSKTHATTAVDKSLATQAHYNWMTDGNKYWSDLPKEIQDAAGDLGYDEDAWDNGKQPEESDKVWEDLNPKQQAAASKIGYDMYTWDGIDPPASEEQIMMEKVRELVEIKMRKEHPHMPQEDFDQVIDNIMSLPKERIKEYLQKPLAVPVPVTSAGEPPMKQQKTIATVSDSEEEESDDEDINEAVASFVLDTDEDDTKPMDSSSSSASLHDDEGELISTGFVLDVNEDDNKPMDEDDDSSSSRNGPSDEESDGGNEESTSSSTVSSPKQEANLQEEKEKLLFDQHGEPEAGLDNLYVPADDETDLEDETEHLLPENDATQLQQDSVGSGDSSLRQRSLAASANENTSARSNMKGDGKDNEATPLLEASSNDSNDDDDNNNGAPSTKSTKMNPLLILPGLLLVGCGIFVLKSLVNKKV
eukprot:scaffold629_cov140-Cylindrotheca_fusiformis.AAC.1